MQLLPCIFFCFTAILTPFLAAMWAKAHAAERVLFLRQLTSLTCCHGLWSSVLVPLTASSVVPPALSVSLSLRICGLFRQAAMCRV